MDTDTDAGIERESEGFQREKGRGFEGDDENETVGLWGGIKEEQKGGQ